MNDAPSNTIVLSGIPSFGRYLSDYVKLFELDIDQLKGKTVLDCASGGASFPAEALEHGIKVVAVDPLFYGSDEEIAAHTKRDIKHVVTQALEIQHLLGTPSELNTFETGMNYRMTGNAIFLADLARGREEGRYIGGRLPSLDFPDKSFEVTLLGHLLFCYGDRLSFEFHRDSILELVRLTKEKIHIYPLRGLDLQFSAYLEAILKVLSEKGIRHEIQNTRYQEIKGWDEQLIIYPTRP